MKYRLLFYISTWLYVFASSGTNDYLDKANWEINYLVLVHEGINVKNINSRGLGLLL